MTKKTLMEAALNPIQHIRRIKGAPLAKVFWTLFDELGMSLTALETSMNDYIRKDAPIEHTAQKHSEKFSNLSAEITSTKRMSWGKFIEALRAIRVKRVRVTFEVWRGSNDSYAKAEWQADLVDIDADGGEIETTEIEVSNEVMR